MAMTPFLNEIKSPFLDLDPMEKSKKLHGDHNGKIKIYSMSSKNRGIFCFVNIINFQGKKHYFGKWESYAITTKICRKMQVYIFFVFEILL